MLQAVRRFRPLVGNSHLGRLGIQRLFSSEVSSTSSSPKKDSDASRESENERQRLIAEITKKLKGPLVDEKGNIPTGAARPVAIEVDGPSHFYVNTTKYTAYTKLKHRLLTRMGYKVLHVPYYEWRKLRGAHAREQYMKAKLLEEPSEWLDPEDEKFYTERLSLLESDLKTLSSQPRPPSSPRPR